MPACGPVVVSFSGWMTHSFSISSNEEEGSRFLNLSNTILYKKELPLPARPTAGSAPNLSTTAADRQDPAPTAENTGKSFPDDGNRSDQMALEVRLNCLLPVFTSLLLSLVIDSHPLSERIFSSTAAIRAASNETIKKAPDIAAEVGRYADLAKHIIELAVFGAAQNRSYRRLADFTDTVGNRVSGSQNLEMAIKYMHNAMTQDGLDVHLEPVKIPHWVRGQESAEMILPRAKSLAILGLGSSVGTPPEGVKAEVLVVQSFEELKRRASEAAERIVVFNQPFISYGETVSYRAFSASEAARLGAVATLIRSVTPFSINSPHTGSQTYQEGVKRIPTACITVEDAELMWRLAQNKQKIVVRLIMGAQTLPDADSFNTVAEIRGWQHPEQ
ncbi:hypothetical protein GOODEAATRI_017217, partial [Goodea atripinnis]